MNYIPLRVKTNYSLLTSLNTIESLAKRAKELNINALSITDDNMFGVMEFYKTMLKYDIKPIIGLEVKINDYSILLYAENYKGYQNLCYICSNEKTIQILKENSDNVLCIVPYESINIYDEISPFYKNIFVSYKTKEERNDIKNKKCVFANEIRVLNKEDKEYLKYLYMIKDGVKLSDKKEYIFDNYNYLLDNDEVLNLMDKNDIINYKIIIDSINLKIEKNTGLLPKYNEDENFDEFKYLTELCKKGLLKRLDNKVPIKYADRLMYELNIINKMGFCNYFLVVFDYVRYSKRNNILVGPGRGSAAGSLVSYSLGITDIDPINKYGNKRVAQILTFSTLKAKQVLRDISRIFDLPSQKTDDFIKLIDSNLSLSENKKSDLVKDKLEKDTLLTRIYDIASHLENLKRQTSIHAAGVIISRENLDRYI